MIAVTNMYRISQVLMTKQSMSPLFGLLEIVLITYNRHTFLRQTLSQLAESPFRDIKITVFDNNSSDSTPEVCEYYYNIFPNFSVVRHKRNIGGNANYLRAIEHMTSEYGWVLCDDDTFDFSGASQVIQSIESREYDILYVASTEELTQDQHQVRTAQELIAAGSRLHHAFSFFPSIIFKTALYDESSLRKGYDYIYDLYPSFPFLNSLIDRNALIYISPDTIVIRNTVNSSGFTGLRWYAAWINCTRSIHDKRLRTKIINEATAKHGFFKTVAFWIAFEKAHDPMFFWQNMLPIIFGLSWARRLGICLLFPLMIVPIPLHVLLSLRRKIYAWMGVKEIPPAEVEIRN